MRIFNDERSEEFPGPKEGAYFTMEIIWLQRPHDGIPWGFRLQGGRDFGQPISVQRVTPGSVASGSLSPGDIILKVGSINVINVSHAEVQDIIRHEGNTLQFTVKRVPKVPASCPVSPTSFSHGNISYTAPASPISFRSLSPVSDGFPNYNNRRNMYADDSFDNPRQFQSLPRRVATGNSSNYSDTYDQHSFNRYDGNAPYGRGSYTMPKPTPYRPSAGNIPTSHFRSTSSDSSGYQTSSYDQSPNTFESPLSPGRNPVRVESTSYQQSPNYPHGPGPGIPPPSYQSSFLDRDQNFPSYQRQGSVGSYRDDTRNINGTAQPSYNTQVTSFSPNNSVSKHFDSQPYTSSPKYQSQSSRGSDSSGFTPYNQFPRDYQTGNQVERSEPTTPSGGFQRRTSTDNQRQPSYGSNVHSPVIDNFNPTGVKRQTSVSSNIGDNSIPRGFKRQPSLNLEKESEKENTSRFQYQRQTSSGTLPKYESTISSTSSPTSGNDINKPEPPVRSQSYDRTQRKPSSTGINSIEDILSPFEKFHASNYYNEFYNKSAEPRHEQDSGVASDFSEPHRSFQSPTLSSSSDLSRHYQSPNFFDSKLDTPPPPRRQIHNLSNQYADRPQEQQSYSQVEPSSAQMNHMVPPPPPPQPVLPPAPPLPPPPPPPPPPLMTSPGKKWTSPKSQALKQNSSHEQRTPGDGSPVQQGQFGEKMPDAILNTMLKQQGSGTPKPFAYITGGIDLKEFKQRKNKAPPPVMPKSYRGPDLGKPEEVVPEVSRAPPRQTHVHNVPRPVHIQSPQQPMNIQSPPMPPERGVYKHVQYNSPIQVYSTPNAEEQFRMQSGQPGTGASGYPEKPPKDIQESAVYKMVQESEAQGKRVIYPNEEDKPRFLNAKKHGMSFRVLQWLTETEDADYEEQQPVYECKKPRQPRDPLLRHNSFDDEMRFSGLNKKTDIPSKTFMKLNKYAVNDDDAQESFDQNTVDNSYENNEDDDSRVGKYEQASIRYLGKHIPSPSFRVLQRFADESQSSAPQPPPTSKQINDSDDNLDDTDDGLPDTLSGEEIVDKRYMGGNIPSRSFKMLQMSIGNGNEDKVKQDPPQEHARYPEPEPPVHQHNKPKITIITRSKAVPQAETSMNAPMPPPQDAPCTDF